MTLHSQQFCTSSASLQKKTCTGFLIRVASYTCVVTARSVLNTPSKAAFGLISFIHRSGTTSTVVGSELRPKVRAEGSGGQTRGRARRGGETRSVYVVCGMHAQTDERPRFPLLSQQKRQTRNFSSPVSGRHWRNKRRTQPASGALGVASRRGGSGNMILLRGCPLAPGLKSYTCSCPTLDAPSLTDLAQLLFKVFGEVAICACDWKALIKHNLLPYDSEPREGCQG